MAKAVNDPTLLGIIPASLLVAVGDVLRTPYVRGETRKWRMLLIGEVALVFLVALSVWWNIPLTGPTGFLLFLALALLPSACGLLALFFQRQLERWSNASARDKTISVAAILAALLISGLLVSIFPFPLFMLLYALLIVPPPLIIPGQPWCYEGGDGYYRLAYKYREYFSSRISTKVHAAEGSAPPTRDCP